MDTRPSAFAPPPYRHWLSWAGLLLILYLAVGLIGFRRALITTEIWALYYAGQPWTELWQAIRYDMVHPPLIYLLERAWMYLFGQTDSAVKALALVINIPTLILFPWLASRVTRHWRLASFLFAGTYLSVGSTPNQMRMYGLGLLLAVTAMLLWEWWRKEPGAGKLIAWAFVMLLLVYTHFFGLLLLAAFFAVNWLFGPRRWWFTGAAAVVGFAYLPWLAYVVPVYFQDGLRVKIPWVNARPSLLLAELPYGYLGYFSMPEWRAVLSVAAGFVHLALFLLAWRGLCRLWPPQRGGEVESRWFWTLAILAGLPIVLLYGFSLLITPAFHWRFVLGVLPSYWLLVVLLGEWGGRAGRAMLYAVVLPWVLASVGLTMAQSLHPSPARQATTFLNREYRDADLILCDGLDCGNQVYWEWTRRLGRTGRIEVLRFGSPAWRLSVLPQKKLGQLDLSQVSRVWFLQSDRKAADTVPGFLAARGFAPAEMLAESIPGLRAFVRAGPTPGADAKSDNAASAGPRLTLHPAERFQRFEAWRASATGPYFRVNGGNRLVPASVLEPVLDDIAFDLGLTGVRIAVHSFQGIEDTNDNEDPFSINWAGFEFEKPYMCCTGGRTLMDPGARMSQVVLPLKQRVESRGVSFSSYITPIYSYGRFPRHWHDPDEYAEMVEAYLTWLRNDFDFTPDYWVMVNEPSARFFSDGNEVAASIRAVGRRLQEKGFPTKIAFPEAVTPGEAVWMIDSILQDQEVTPYIGMISYHGYDYNSALKPSSSSLGLRQTIAEKARQLGVPTAMTEICCKRGWNSGDYRHGLALARDIYWSLTEANASVWEPLGLMFPCQKQGCSPPGGGGDVIYLEPDLSGYQKLPNYYAMRQFMRHIRPGYTRVNITCSGCRTDASVGQNVKPVAFISPAGKYVAVLINDQTTAQSLRLAGFPAGTYKVTGVDPSHTRGRAYPNQTIGAGEEMALEVPARAVVTLVQQ